MPDGEPWWKSLLPTAVAWLVLLGLYLLMAGQLSISEIVAGLLFASMITLLSLSLQAPDKAGIQSCTE